MPADRESPKQDRRPDHLPEKEKVLVIGASARAVAASVHRAGAWPIAVDLFYDLDTRAVAPGFAVADFNSIPNSLAESGFLAEAKTSIYVGGIENHPEIVSHLEEHTRLLGNNADILLRLADDRGLTQWLADRGVSTPETFDSLDSIPASMLQTNTTPTVRFLEKEHRSSGGLGVRFVEPDDRRFARPNTSCRYQQFLPGTCWSACFVAWHHRGTARSFLIGTSRQSNGDPSFNASGFRYSGSIIDNDPGQEHVYHLRSIGQYLAEDFGLTGLYNVDFIVSNGKLFFLEVNPRITSSMDLFERQYGINLYTLQKMACTMTQLGEPDDTDDLMGFLARHDLAASDACPLFPLFGKAVWYASRDVVVTDLFCQSAKELNGQRPQPGENPSGSIRYPVAADIPVPGTSITKGSPFFTVYAGGESTAEVAEKLITTARMLDSQA